MPNFQTGAINIHYEESGPADGFPLLLIAPGGMKSAIALWANAPWNPIEHLSGDFRIIAMDQRNAGQSSAPVTAEDSWASYAADQLGLMDHLGVERFMVAGMCIGGAYCMGLIETAPERIAAAVLFQPIGLEDNRDAFYQMYDGWAAELAPQRPEVDEGAWAAVRENMYGGDFLFNVSREFTARVTTPLLVLKGNDIYHPEAISREVAALAANATLIEDWKEGEAVDSARQQVTAFLKGHAH
ncbi:MAG: alpha/beta hydrolase [Gammaproteobacteria bacterium]|nr:alpha/beta hydrolase [Gammaproteobacteria bacterium]